jgi:hypothetical protein
VAKQRRSTVEQEVGKEEEVAGEGVVKTVEE